MSKMVTAKLEQELWVIVIQLKHNQKSHQSINNLITKQ